MNSEIVDFFSRTPYSIPNVIGFFLVIQAIVFFEVGQRSRDQYSKPLALGLFLLGIAWGTSDYQNTGKVYVDWQWWWAQPFFALGIFFMCVGVVRYLPLNNLLKKRLSYINGFFAFGYVLLGTALLLLELQVPRAFIIWMQLPPFFAICASTLQAEKNEPKKGHRVIGLLAILVPMLSILFPLIGLKSAVLRFWTAIPLITLSSIVLSVSLLRERERIQENLDKLRLVENQLIEANKDLEVKVSERTALLHEIITDLESFNRNVSHDLRSPLGSISLTAEIAEKYLATGNMSYAVTELSSIKEQVVALQSMVGTMLNLAYHIDSPPTYSEVNFTDYMQMRVQKLQLQFARKYPTLVPPNITVNDHGAIRVNEPLLNIVVDNILENAIKYNLGRADLQIVIGCSTDEREERIYISDNGIGITDADTSEIFIPFKQIESSQSAIVSGYGLGLSIVQRAVKKLGGKVWHEETPGGGATFIFTLAKS
jgi:signal transduction histidine kinase